MTMIVVDDIFVQGVVVFVFVFVVVVDFDVPHNSILLDDLLLIQTYYYTVVVIVVVVVIAIEDIAIVDIFSKRMTQY